MAHNSVSPIDEGKYKTIKGTTKPIKSSLKDTDSHISDETSNKFRDLAEHLDLLLEPMEASDDEQAVKDGLDASDDDEHLATMHRQYTQPENMHHASGEVLRMAEDDLEDPLFPNKQLPPKKRISKFTSCLAKLLLNPVFADLPKRRSQVGMGLAESFEPGG
jgi:hypothetical protein